MTYPPSYPFDSTVGYDRRKSLWDDGVEHDYPDRQFHQPHKARRNKPLDFIQKLANQLQNSFRAPVENALAHLKRFKLLAGIYRGPVQTYDDTFLAISGLHNFRKMGTLSW